MQTTAIDTAAALLGKIHDLRDIESAKEFCSRATVIIDTIEITMGMWCELNYRYKAEELLAHVWEQSASRRAEERRAAQRDALQLISNRATRLVSASCAVGRQLQSI